MLNACQKVVVEWLLYFFYPILRKVPNLKLGGDIPSQTKFKWENELMLERRKAIEPRVGGYAAEVADVFGDFCRTLVSELKSP